MASGILHIKLGADGGLNSFSLELEGESETEERGES